MLHAIPQYNELDMDQESSKSPCLCRVVLRMYKRRLHAKELPACVRELLQRHGLQHQHLHRSMQKMSSAGIEESGGRRLLFVVHITLAVWLVGM